MIVEQTGRLGQANEEKATSIWIVDTCEAEKQAAADKLTERSVWQRITPWRE